MNAAEKTAPEATALQALLDMLEAERRAQCGQRLAEARAEAAALREHARAEARTRVREAFAEQRRRRDQREAAARARLATRRRLHAQQHTAALLALALERLPQELRALWAEPDTRRAWAAATLAGARQQLPAGPWLVRHASGLTAEERAALGEGLQFAEEAALDAGLRVEAGPNVIDGTLAGLLADRAAFEARLLRALEPPA